MISSPFLQVDGAVGGSRRNQFVLAALLAGVPAAGAQLVADHEDFRTDFGEFSGGFPQFLRHFFKILQISPLGNLRVNLLNALPQPL